MKIPISYINATWVLLPLPVSEQRAVHFRKGGPFNTIVSGAGNVPTWLETDCILWRAAEITEMWNDLVFMSHWSVMVAWIYNIALFQMLCGIQVASLLWGCVQSCPQGKISTKERWNSQWLFISYMRMCVMLLRPGGYGTRVLARISKMPVETAFTKFLLVQI